MMASVSTISGELGGNMLLGRSVLTICEFFDFLWESIKSRMRRPNEQNSVSSSEFLLKLSTKLLDVQIYRAEIKNMNKHVFSRNHKNIMFYLRLSKTSFVLFNMAWDAGRPIATSSLAWPPLGLKSSLRSLRNT